MPLAEALVILGAAIGKGLVKVWAGDAPLINETTSGLVDIMKAKLPRMLDGQRAADQVNAIAVRITETLKPVFSAEGIEGEASREAVALAVASTLDQTQISADLVVSVRLDPSLLLQRFRASEIHGNTTGFSDAERRLYDRVLAETAGAITRVASGLPSFTETVFQELLAQNERLLALAAQSAAADSDAASVIRDVRDFMSRIDAGAIRRHDEAKRKNWRELSVVKLPLRSGRLNYFPFTRYVIATTLKATFPEPYTRFRCLASTEMREVDGVENVHCQIVCQYSHFLEQLRRNTIHFFRLIFDAQGTGRESPNTAKVAEYERRLLASDEPWTIAGSLPNLEDFWPIEMTLDRPARMISVEAVSEVSPYVSEYEHRLSTTSEFLTWLPAVNGAGIRLLELEDLSGQYRMEKVAVTLLDEGGLDVRSVRVNVADEEEWDYVNLKYDDEIGHLRQKG